MVYVGTDQGHLVAIADPSIHPAAGWRCNDPLISNLTCSIIQALSPNSIVRLVPDPAVLADVTLPGAGSIFGEPSLTRNRVFIAGSGGKLFMLEVDP
jgi:hypothetical protein